MTSILPEHPAMNDEDYQRFDALIISRTGLRSGERRRKTLERSLDACARRAGSGSPEEYFHLLEGNPTSAAPWDDLIHTITICETYFFRDPEQMSALRNHILPDLIARQWSSHDLRVWCAGCSTGEEPYTLAIILRQLIPDLHRWKVHLLATDINRQALKKAQRAHYRDWSFRQVEESQRSLHFSQHGETWEPHPGLRSMVTFAYLNLMEEIYPSPVTQTEHMHLILCRNVTMYLPEVVIRSVAERFYQCLSPGGWLMVGASEANDGTYHRFQPLHFGGAMAYQKMGELGPSQYVQPGRSPAYIAAMPAWRVETLPLSPAAVPSAAISFIAPAPAPHFPLEMPGANSAAALSTQFIRTAEPNVPGGQGLVRLQGSEPKKETADREVADVLYARGSQLLKQRRLHEAGEVFLECAERFPRHIPALIALARLAANAGRLDEARRWAGRALEAEPLHSEAHYIQALVHQEHGELEKALEFFKKTLYLDPEYILAHFAAAGLYQKLGQPAEAARSRANTLRLANKLAPDALIPGSDNLSAAELVKMAGAV